jgi:hypothetical protein
MHARTHARTHRAKVMAVAPMRASSGRRGATPQNMAKTTTTTTAESWALLGSWAMDRSSAQPDTAKAAPKKMAKYTKNGQRGDAMG